MNREAPHRLRRLLRVGVTLHLREGSQSIWENGIYQNVVFLAQVLAASPAVAEVVLVSDRQGDAPPHAELMLGETQLRIVQREEALATLDVVIEMSAQLPEDWVAEFRRRGGRYAWMRVGNDYVIDIERAMFDKPHAGLCNDKVYDAVWTLPEYAHSCTDYFSLGARAPVRIVPHLWTPYFFERGIASLPEELTYGYVPGRARWRVCCFEPNVCTVKTSVIPLALCEEAYRAQPRMLDHARFCNTLDIKSHGAYREFASSLDVVRHGLATFEGRFPVYEFMAREGDCVVSHHWENGQNYLYYEALYGGYPLVHNSEFIRGCGYYYPGFDCQAGGRALQRAFAEHDLNLSDYRRSASRLLGQLDVAHPDNVETYTRELLAVAAA